MIYEREGLGEEKVNWEINLEIWEWKLLREAERAWFWVESWW